ncbi:MAG TPA: LPS export ABC transporter permease LptF [Alphaproteobacteria bacterium]|nr:LPS export ABC transporter permease LptF [Alphaproteobacteria bacterium]
MDGLTRYVLKQLMVGMIFVTIGLTSVIWLTQSLRFIELIINRGLTVGVFLYMTILLLPNFLSLILPIALFTVVTFIYSKMISDRELLVMRGAGLSQMALAKPALILAMIVVVVGYALNLYLLPESYRKFRELQWDIRYNYSHTLLQEGTFNTVARDVTVYIRKRTSDGQLHGILVHDQRNKAEPVTLIAERGALVEGKGGNRVVMFKGNRQSIDPKTKQMSILYFDRYVFDMGGGKPVSDVRYREAREQSMSELFNLDKKNMNPNDVGKFTIEAHKRIASPIMALGFTMVALAFLISGGFSRRAQNRRNIAAVTVVVMLQGAALGIENSAAKELALIPLIYVNAIAPVILGFFFMLWTPKRKPAQMAEEAFSGGKAA